jgi:tetrahydromethanopterin S-methyltransferase subunit B
MKKRSVFSFGMLILTLLLSVNIHAQDPPKPVFITMTTLHRNLNTDGKDWKATEQEYFDKVTSKNDLIIGSEILTHYYTENSSEVILVSVYKTWEDIDKAEAITEDLIKKVWPDEKARTAFFEKRASYYMPMHSDEIYSSIETIGQKEFKTTTKEPMIVYIRRSQMSMTGKGKGMKEYNEKVTMKDPFIKAYYPFRHAWGSDSRDFMEAYFYDSFSDIEKSNLKQDELVKAAWPKEADSKAFFDELKLAFTGIHGDYIYHNLPVASK